MHYIEVSVRCDSGFSEILIAELGELGFDTFQEQPSGFLAYVEEDRMDYEGLKDLMERYASLTPLHYSMQKVARENWNRQWEENYPPIVIDDEVLIKTPFHQIDENYPVVLTVVPKMSFGTGHHATTSQMIRFLSRFRPEGLRVLDAGTGTGILAIMAEKTGARQVTGFDNDPWCIENSEENFTLNGCTRCRVVQASSVKELPGGEWDLILANINKNVILSETAAYAAALQPGGQLWVSGFYTEDVPDIEKSAGSKGFRKLESSVRDTWACLIFEKLST
jgi:ribosomal protein L11 methyltransferase